MAFGNLKPKKITIDQKESLQQLTKLYRSLDNEVGREIYTAHQLYLENRENLLKTHKNQYVHVTPNKIIPIDRLENRPKTIGVFYLVGKEIQECETAYYSNNLKVDCPMLPICFGFENNPNLWAIDQDGTVDTGCTTTTFDMNIYRQITNINPKYALNTTQINIQAVGSVNTVLKNSLDIKFGDKMYKNHPVVFADVNNVTLVGRDLLNGGVLNYESKKWISFTKH